MVFGPVFNKLTAKWGEPDMGMLVSRLYFKVLHVASVVAIDAFTLDWSRYERIYCFPPFSLIGKVLQYIQENQP